MMKFFSGLLLFLAFFVAVGCSAADRSGPLFDTSTMESYFESVKEMKKELPPAEFERFEKAFRILAARDAPLAEDKNPFEVFAKDITSSPGAGHILSKLDKKTAAEIIAMAKIKLKVRYGKEIGKLLDDIKELQKRKDEYEKLSDVLAKVVLKDPGIHMSELEGMDMYTPVFNVTMTNNTGSNISIVTFLCTVMESDNETPLIVADYTVYIHNEFKKGETRLLEVQVDPSNELGRIDVRGRKGVTLDLEVINITDSHKRRLAPVFGVNDRRRLKALNETKEMLENQMHEGMTF